MFYRITIWLFLLKDINVKKAVGLIYLNIGRSPMMNISKTYQAP